MNIKLSEVLQREIKNRGESINGMAKSCGIPPSVLHGWANGVIPSGKNIHLIKRLADYLSLSVSILLFNQIDEVSSDTVLFSSTFVDGSRKYRLIIERIGK